MSLSWYQGWYGYVVMFFVCFFVRTDDVFILSEAGPAPPDVMGAIQPVHTER